MLCSSDSVATNREAREVKNCLGNNAEEKLVDVGTMYIWMHRFKKNKPEPDSSLDPQKKRHAACSLNIIR